MIPPEAYLVVGVILGFLMLVSIASLRGNREEARKFLPRIWIYALLCLALLFSAGALVNFGGEAVSGEPSSGVAGIIRGMGRVLRGKNAPFSIALILLAFVLLARLCRLVAKLWEGRW